MSGNEMMLLIVAQTLPLNADTYRTAMRLNAVNRRFRTCTWRPRGDLQVVPLTSYDADGTHLRRPCLWAFNHELRIDATLACFVLVHNPSIAYIHHHGHGTVLNRQDFYRVGRISISSYLEQKYKELAAAKVSCNADMSSPNRFA